MYIDEMRGLYDLLVTTTGRGWLAEAIRCQSRLDPTRRVSRTDVKSRQEVNLTHSST